MFRHQIRWSSNLARKPLASRLSKQSGSSKFARAPPPAPAVAPKEQSAKSSEPNQGPKRASKAQKNQRPPRKQTSPPAAEKTVAKAPIPTAEDATSTNKPRKKDAKKKSQANAPPPPPPPPAPRPKTVKTINAKKPTIAIPRFISIANLAHMFKMRLPALQAQMQQLGFEDKEHDHLMDAETAALIAEELGYEAIVNDQQGEDIFPASTANDHSAPLRPPIITIMGHIDHGKTSILDYIRRSKVAAGEHGGITQHIGAFSVAVGGRRICFLDTPGHAAFLNMRQRGADVTDIAVLVVAADDAVMPQTKEAIKHAKNAGVPMIVAINKCDLPDADVDKVVSDLAANNVDVEPYGGETQVIPVSALKGTNIEKLEEAILTLSEVMELRAPPTGNAEGWVIESEVKKGLGSTATVLVRRGCLKPGSFIVAGKSWCKVRSLTDDNGKRVKQAGPGTPVEVLGWKELPEAGDEVLQAKNEAHAKQVVDNRVNRESQLQQLKDVEVLNENRRLQHQEQERQAAREERLKLGLEVEEADEEQNTGDTKDKLMFVVKADVSGSAEAVRDSIEGLGNNDIEAKVLFSGVGAVTETDVVRAESAGAAILTFNLAKITKEVALLAGKKGVDIINHSIIYRLLEDVTSRLSAQLKPEIRHKVLAEALIKDVFDITVKKTTKRVAGCRVTNGVLQRNATVKVLRDREEIYRGTLSSMKHHKEEVSQIKKDTDCGLGFDKWSQFEVGDVIQAYEEIKLQRHL